MEDRGRRTDGRTDGRTGRRRMGERTYGQFHSFWQGSVWLLLSLSLSLSPPQKMLSYLTHFPSFAEDSTTQRRGGFSTWAAAGGPSVLPSSRAAAWRVDLLIRSRPGPRSPISPPSSPPREHVKVVIELEREWGGGGEKERERERGEKKKRKRERELERERARARERERERARARKRERERES
jgi:hypothetical protein